MRTVSLFAIGSLVLSGLPVSLASVCRLGPHASSSSSSISASSSSASPSASPSISPSPPNACSNVVQNPDFANGLTYWDKNTQSNGVYTVTASTSCGTSAGDPATCAVLYGYTVGLDSAVAAVYQTGVTVTPGSTYTMSFRYRLVSNNAPCSIFSIVNDVQSNGVQFGDNSPGNGAWASYTTTWTAPTTPSTKFPDTTKAAITVLLYTDGTTTAWISDITFDACQEVY